MLVKYEYENIHPPRNLSILWQPNLHSKVPKEFQTKIKYFQPSTTPSSSFNNIMQAISAHSESVPSDVQVELALHLSGLTPTKYKIAPQLINKSPEICNL